MRNSTHNCLEEMFQSMSVEEIAKNFGVSVTAARNYLKSIGLRRSLSDANRLRYRKHPAYLTLDQEQLVYGSLLGDACLYKQIKKTHFTLKVCFAHCEAQRDYLEFKHSIIGGSRIGLVPRSEKDGHLGGNMYSFAYSNTQGLLPVEQIVIHDGKKKVSAEWISKLDWAGLAFWYQDDASLLLQNNKPWAIRWYTNSFSMTEIDLLCDLLKSRGLTSLSIARGNSATEPVIVAYRQKDIIDFVNHIKPYSVQCLCYKFQV